VRSSGVVGFWSLVLLGWSLSCNHARKAVATGGILAIAGSGLAEAGQPLPNRKPAHFSLPSTGQPPGTLSRLGKSPPEH